MRCQQAMTTKAPSNAVQVWKNCKTNRQKKDFTLGYLKDPNFKEKFFSAVQSIDAGEGLKRKYKWLSRKQLLAEMDESEAEEGIDNGSIITRGHPQVIVFYFP